MTDELVYFDNAATSFPKPPGVLEAMRHFTEEIGANPGRSGHRLSIRAGEVLVDTRDYLAELFNIRDSLRIAFTKNASEALNLAIAGVVEPGDHVITTSMEHNSVSRPLRYLANEKVIELTIVQCDKKSGTLDPIAVEKALKKNTKLVIMVHASNATGTLQPIGEIGAITRENDVILAIDAAQTAGSYPIDVEAMKIDLLCFTGHKALFGPQGTGGIYVRPGLQLKPLMRGGTGSRSEEDIQPDFMPDLLECGTPNTVGVAGLGAGVQFIMSETVEKIRDHEVKVTKQLLEGLGELNAVTIYGPENVEERMPIVSVNIDGLYCSKIAEKLDEDCGIMVRAGLHCAPWAHRTLGTHPEGTLRFSLGYFNTAEEVDYVLDALARIIKDKRR